MEKVEEIHRKFNLDENDCDGVDLQLGLSMNGRFGVDPAVKKLRRSSSVALVVEESGGSSSAAAREAHAPLGRTCSLPAVSEEEFRRRKEEQSARRLEARKKRMEKKNAAAAARGGVKEKERESSDEDGSVNFAENGGERSIGSSQRTGSSGVCDPPSQQIEAQNTEVRSPSLPRPVQMQAPQEPQGRPPIPPDRNGNGKRTVADMPYVSTREGNRIEGFLYRYRKGEEVKIVCVCHGLFLSPAEFVKHGGGGDVENPLRHIVVNPSPPLV